MSTRTASKNGNRVVAGTAPAGTAATSAHCNPLSLRHDLVAPATRFQHGGYCVRLCVRGLAGGVLHIAASPPAGLCVVGGGRV